MKLKVFKERLIDPAVSIHDVDGLEFSIAHREVLQRKRILQDLVKSLYKQCRTLDLSYFGDCPGQRIEIGSGTSIIQTIYPDVITSDIKPLPFIDIALRAEKMPFRAGTLRSIIAINVFHHFLDPRAFFREALRVLHPGGGVILIEPFHGPLARLVFKHLHKTEGFDPDVLSWEPQEPVGPFSNANQALSYIMFKRDRAQFEQEFSELPILFDSPHTHLWWLMSGGVNFRQLMPDNLTPLVRIFEQALSPFNRWLALQHTIVFRKDRVENNSTIPNVLVTG